MAEITPRAREADALREALSEMADAQRALWAAREARDDAWVALSDAGAGPPEIERLNAAIAAALTFTPEVAKALGLSKSTVHTTLRIRRRSRRTREESP